jgi:hypothetical protein
MTVREAISVLKTAQKIAIGYGSDSIPFNKDNPVSLDAFADYIVDDIKGFGDDYYEVNILMKPVRKGDA